MAIMHLHIYCRPIYDYVFTGLSVEQQLEEGVGTSGAN